MTSNSTSPFSLQGRVVLITGSSTGLGKAMAAAFGQAGAKVAMNYFNNTARAEKSFGEFKQKGCQGMLVRANVTDQGEVEKMVREVNETLGPVDILVVNATDATDIPIRSKGSLRRSGYCRDGSKSKWASFAH